MASLRDGGHWRWLLADRAGTPIADHEVAIDPSAWTFDGFVDLHRFLRRHVQPDRPAESEAEIVDRVGCWIGETVLGPVGEALIERAPVTVEVLVPAEAEWLMFRPWELAQVQGRVLARAGVSLVFVPAGLRAHAKQPIDERLRMLAVFSLPAGQSVLALRRERYELQRLVAYLAGRNSLAIELRVLQYGVTRERLRHAARDGGGWDLLHMSGHGLAEGLLLERADGSEDLVPTEQLIELLRPMRRRTKLAVLSSCQSGAARAAETLRWLHLYEPAQALDAAAEVESPATSEGGVPALGRAVMEALDCAVLAMRYPVSDLFAVRFAGELYGLLLDHGQELDEAVANALAAIGEQPDAAELPAASVGTPTLLGARAAGLVLRPPAGRAAGIAAGGARMAGFPDEPPRFIGRAATMAAATTALASESSRSGVIFHGIAGAGKTSCALELAYRHETAFAAHAFWRAPQSPEEALGSLSQCAQRLETLLGPQLEGGFPMTTAVVSDHELDRFLPQLTEVMSRTGMLIVLDNLETLLTADGEWRDPRWARVIRAMTDHRGLSRVVMSSRVVPRDLEPAVERLPIGALSLAEAVLLARELPNLGALMTPSQAGDAPRDRDGDRALVRRALAVVQGHPKLLELADAAAHDRAELTARLAAAERDADEHGPPLEAFFTVGESEFEPRRFLTALRSWTTDAAAALDDAARLLLEFLSCMQEDDRLSVVLNDNWGDLWRRLERPGPAPALEPLLDVLAGGALIDRSGVEILQVGDATDHHREATRYGIHPGIAETMRAAAGPALQRAVDEELSLYWLTVLSKALEVERSQATGGIIPHAALAGLPYLLRLDRWSDAEWAISRAALRMSSVAQWRLLPYMRHVAEVTNDPKTEGILGQLLAVAAPREAEERLRRSLAGAWAASDLSTVRAAYTGLISQRMRQGAFVEAIALCDERSERLESLPGSWSRFSDDVQRLQIRLALEPPAGLRGEVERLMRELTELDETEARLYERWKVPEALFGVGHEVSVSLGQWQEALVFNQRTLSSMHTRGAAPEQMAAIALKGVPALLELEMLDACEQLLDQAQGIFETTDNTEGLELVFAARADLERVRGHPTVAAELSRTALRLSYARYEPFGVQTRHHNLGLVLCRASGDPSEALDHVLASALLCRQGSMANELDLSLHAITRMRAMFDGRLREPRSFEELVERVDGETGIRFGELFGELVADAATAERHFAEVMTARPSDAFSQALVSEQLRKWQAAIAAIVAAARGDRSARERVDTFLAGLDDEWIALKEALSALLDGKRGEVLLEGLDETEAAILGAVLRDLEAPSVESESSE